MAVVTAVGRLKQLVVISIMENSIMIALIQGLVIFYYLLRTSISKNQTAITSKG